MKDALSTRHIPFVERVLDLDIPTAEVVRAFPSAKSLPILSVGGHALGGVEELQALIDSDTLKYLIKES